MSNLVKTTQRLSMRSSQTQMKISGVDDVTAIHITLDATERALRRALDSTQLGTMASIDSEGYPHVNTCFFSFNQNLRRIEFLSSPSASHSKNVIGMPQVGFNIIPSCHEFGTPLLGVQLLGICTPSAESEGEDIYSNYALRFPKIRSWANTYNLFCSKFESRLYVISIYSGKVIDESTLGQETYVKFEIE